MEAQISISGGDAVEEITELREWLCGERGLAGTVRVVLRAPDPEEMGPMFDVLAVAVGSGGAATALARALVVWLQTRRPNVSVTVTNNGRSVSVQARDLNSDTVMPLLRQVLESGGGEADGG
jgi:hypothetical protein